MERDADKTAKTEFVNISTHTLTWSVTKRTHRLRLRLQISTHTLTWSVTEEASEVKYAGYNFNSHAHVERDLFDNKI